MGRVTIRDVARAAEVAPSTVSLYMRGMAGVARDTGRRIAAAMQELGYEPDIRRPQEPAGGLVALVLEQSALSSFSEVFYGEIIEGIETAARAAKLGVLLAVARKGEALPQLELESVRGCIILGESTASRAAAEQMLARDLPVVLVDHYFWDLPVHAVLPDNRAGGYMAAKHLLDLGHERIAILPGSPKYHTLLDRAEGARRALRDAGVKCPARYRPRYRSAGEKRKGYREMQQLLTASPPPTAVFAVSDRTAVGAMAAIQEAGRRIPQDISIVGFDDVAVTEPALTTIGVSKGEIGRIALQRFSQILRNGIGTPTRTGVRAELIIRDSTLPQEQQRVGLAAGDHKGRER